MTDLSDTITPKSNQLNADDLVAGPITIRITAVSKAASDQPIAISFDGDSGRPFLPCKSMRRVLVVLWGADGSRYIGRRLTLYRDDKVRWGGAEVGGIRISHASHISAPVKVTLTESKSSRKPVVIQPLPDEPGQQKVELTAEVIEELNANADYSASKGVDSYRAFWTGLGKAERDALLGGHDGRKAVAKAADAEALTKGGTA